MNYQKVICLGRSGSGKSFSLHSLDPETTGIINVDKKELSFGNPGYTTQLNGKLPDLEKSNYVETDKFTSVMKTLDVWSTRNDLETIVLDTVTHLISSDYVNNTIGRDFKAYQTLALNFWKVLDRIREINKHIVVFGHIEELWNDNGERVVSMKSHGKMINSFEPQSYFTTMLFAEVHSDEGEISYMFKTAPTSVYEQVKSPARIIDGKVVKALEPYEPNDMNLILSKLNKFYNHN